MTATVESAKRHLRTSRVLLWALSVRISIALVTRTFFQPDEYFQSLEPAHRIVFGYGQLTWEWLNPKPIRSIFYPALNVPVYFLLKLLGVGVEETGWWGDLALVSMGFIRNVWLY
jgi:phosphatidylinositol glycan class B